MARRDANQIPAYRLGSRSDCPTGKMAYPTKAIAKRRARTMPNDEPWRGPISAFRCIHDICQLWHLGHLPPQVRNGEQSRMDLRN